MHSRAMDEKTQLANSKAELNRTILALRNALRSFPINYDRI